MPSPKRDRRSRSRSRSSESSSSKPKRVLDLVSTRRISPPTHHYRGRGRGPRRPFFHRGGRGYGFRGNFHRHYYPRQPRFNSRDDNRFRDDSHSHSHNRYRRSRSRGHSRSYSRGRSRERSGSRGRHHRSRSDSSSSSSSDNRQHESRSSQRQRSSFKEGKSARLRHSSDGSPDERPSEKKKARRQSPSHQGRHSHRARSDSDEREEAMERGQRASRAKVDEDSDSEPRAGEVKKKLSGSVEQARKRRVSSQDEGRLKEMLEISRSRKVTPPAKKKETVPRNRLHKIFTLISQSTCSPPPDPDFELDEDISIAIQRNPYAQPSEDSTVTTVFDPRLFTMIYSTEGRRQKPIFDREEIKVFGHDKNLADDPDFERRVIRLKPGKSNQSGGEGSSGFSSSQIQQRSSLEITRTVNRSQSASSSDSRSRSPSPEKSRETKFRLQMSTDPRFEARFAQMERKEEGGSGQRSNLDPTDLRHELSSGRRSSSDTRGRGERERESYDDRHRSSDSRNRYDDRSRQQDHRESRPEQKKDREELPDFSRRKDKYQYTPWLDQPELIPKDPKYFQHDDRESMDMRDRGRGRGRFFRGRFNNRRPMRFFHPRGSFRGNYRGRGNYPFNPDNRSRSPRRSYPSHRYDSGKSMEREWKHDKFSELERGDGEKKSHREDDQHPHSTSEISER